MHQSIADPFVYDVVEGVFVLRIVRFYEPGMGPSIDEMMPGQQSEIPAMTKMEAQQAKHEVVEDYETRVPQLSQ
ncbi:hypothetical protein Bca52824_032231 [Brassica carinata]|uniref:Uncharacterized protein n=1 Tax=Brassica carinata TaxID=52824 RepID=A0A8X7SDS7_BRACI|nr:hypothetical protein Bca52824_032231 [Brassica carinata]